MKYKTKKLLVILRSSFKRTKKIVTPKSPKLNDIQVSSVKIVKSIIRNPESVLLIDPITGIRYVKFNDYKTRFGSNFLFIKNCKFSYYVELDYVTCSNLTDYFNAKVSQRRQAMEKEDDMMILNNLDSMYKDIEKDSEQ